jgi:hypothetical protein
MENEDNGEATYDELMGQFGKHMVCLAVSFVYLAGDERGKQRTTFYSGFVISVRGHWLLATAGHIVRDLDDALAHGAIRLVTCKMLDCIQPGAKHAQAYEFDYEEAKRIGVFFDRKLNLGKLDGRDFGLVYLREYYRSLLKANGVTPLPESLWYPPKGTVFDDVHFIVGLPEELIGQKDLGRSTEFSPEYVIVPVRRLETPPRGIAKTKYPRFVGELSKRLVLQSVKGMSGGSIIGIGEDATGKTKYWVVAIQSKELNFGKRRLVFGCPFSYVASLIESAIAEHEASGSAGDEILKPEE